jgi:hypothetical protein
MPAQTITLKAKVRVRGEGRMVLKKEAAREELLVFSPGLTHMAT